MCMATAAKSKMKLTLKQQTLGWVPLAVPDYAGSSNTAMGGWHPDTTREKSSNCSNLCLALLLVTPQKGGGKRQCYTGE